MTTQLPTDAEAFSQFLTKQIADGGPDKLLQIWRQEHAEAIADVRQGYKNMEAGLGRPLRAVDADIRAKFNIPTDA